MTEISSHFITKFFILTAKDKKLGTLRSSLLSPSFLFTVLIESFLEQQKALERIV